MWTDTCLYIEMMAGREQAEKDREESEVNNEDC